MSIPQQGGGPIESRDDLVGYLSSGCKPPENWRIGTEHEKFGYRLSDHKPLPYEGACSIRAMLEGLRDRFGWAPIIEGGNIIGLEKNGANVSLEPGGQLELSGAPLETIHQTCDEVNSHLAEVHEVADAIGAGFIGLGAAPIWRHEDMDTMPKGRYGIMKRYMPKVGSRGLHMMFRTCTVQVNLDFASEPDMVKKLRVALALQPIATALFANSPFWEGKPAGRLSYRAYCWRDLDADRTGMLPFVFEDGFGFERYVDYALDVPMYFVYRDGKYIDVAGQSFRDFLKGQLPGLPGELPTQSDWGDHLTTIFPEARIKKFIEMRGADGGPWRSLCALPALWVGLTYDQTALDAAWDMAKGWSEAEREQLRIDAGKLGLKATIAGRSLQHVAQEVLQIAEAGLKARGRAAGFDRDESHFLNVAQQVAASGRTAAEELLERYNDDWGGDLDRIYDAYSY
ncbi:MAG TPA: glutamate--cysteine ligase [Thermohalobaculum sp.]|nr:glutamate--cysteine ligase [Thermohalobaculum sp.]